MIQQSELLKILKTEYNFEISRQAFSKKVNKGFIRVYYKEGSSRKLYKLNEVLGFLGVEREPKAEKDNSNDNITLEGLLNECNTPLERVRVERAYHRAEKKVLKYNKLLEEYTHKDRINSSTKRMGEQMELGVKNFIPKIKNILHSGNFKDDSFIPVIEKLLHDSLKSHSKLNYKKMLKLEKARYD